MNRHRELLIIILLITLILLSLYADVNFRVVTYNVLNFSYDSGIARYDYFQSVVEAIEPDVVLLQEMINQEGADLFLDILNSNGDEFDAADFIDGYYTDNMLYYRTSIVTFISQDTIQTSLRDISEYVLSIGDNPIRFYTCHLKASQGSSNEQQRLEEVTILRNRLNLLPEDTEFIIAGDMNFYTSSEPAYQKLIADEGDNGRAEDLIDEVGDWHDNPVYAPVHTQSTRTTQFGGGASGGMDDRFDFIFASYGINDSIGIDYIEDTYTSFGNDGNHLNQSINAGTNSAVPADIADALYYASDHLPVYADFVSFGSTSSHEEEITHSPLTKTFLGFNYPNPFNPITNIRFDIKENESGTLLIYNTKGQFIESHQFEAGQHNFSWNAENQSSGVYFYKLQTESFTETRKMILLK
ncbi:MAG: T9SS type A sorting domain-containing protein [Candidatus Cloacimonetes bacterium]|nr:T9SS type A sorting domain-containing protein [Candidatus Cloacimonadota bacterium]